MCPRVKRKGIASLLRQLSFERDQKLQDYLPSSLRYLSNSLSICITSNAELKKLRSGESTALMWTRMPSGSGAPAKTTENSTWSALPTGN